MARTFSKNTSNFVNLGVASLGPLLNGASGITFACWVNPSSFVTTNTTGDDIFIIYHTDLVAFGVLLSNSNTGIGDALVGVRRVVGDANHVFNASDVIAANQWSHVVGSVSFGQAAKIWINGAQASGSVSGAATTTSGTFLHTAGSRGDSLGCFLGPSSTPLSTDRQFNGQMAECGLWNIELNAADINSLYKGFAPPNVRSQNLTCYWPMLAKGTVIEEIRNGKNGTITGSVPSSDHPRIYS